MGRRWMCCNKESDRFAICRSCVCRFLPHSGTIARQCGCGVFVTVFYSISILLQAEHWFTIVWIWAYSLGCPASSRAQKQVARVHLCDYSHDPIMPPVRTESVGRLWHSSTAGAQPLWKREHPTRRTSPAGSHRRRQMCPGGVLYLTLSNNSCGASLGELNGLMWHCTHMCGHVHSYALGRRLKISSNTHTHTHSMH